jgi:hypothetical protein
MVATLDRDHFWKELIIGVLFQVEGMHTGLELVERKQH